MQETTFKGKNWIDAELDFSTEAYAYLIDYALRQKAQAPGASAQILKNKSIFTLFFNRSLRTRVSTAVATAQLGGNHVALNPDEIYTPALPDQGEAYSTERIADVARVLSSMGDALAVRMYGEPTGWIYGQANRYLKAFSNWLSIPVINLECDMFHPTQALADLITLKEKLGDLRGKRFVMSWAYSASTAKPVSVPQSVVLAMTKMGMHVTLTHPEGFELDPVVTSKCSDFAHESDGTFRITNDMEDAIHDADVIYGKSWSALAHYANPEQDRAYNPFEMKTLFEKNRSWRYDENKMSLAKPDALYMHCLPCDRNQEVSDQVVDGRNSVVFDQATNRLHAIKAILSLFV